MSKFFKKCSKICILKKISYNYCISILNSFTKQKMVDQNNIGTQNENQVVMWGNPYDLVDNKNVQAEQNLPNIQQENLAQNQEVVQTVQQVVPVQDNAIPVQNNVVPQQNIQVPQNVPVQQTPVIEEKWPGDFMKWFIKFIAKVSGQPDPETGKAEVVPQNTNIPQNNPNWVVQPVQKSGNAFDAIMGGITGFLDKVEKKVEKVSGIDIDSLGNMPKKEEVVQQPIQQVESPQIPVQQSIPVQTSPIQQVAQEIPQVIVEEPKVEDITVQSPVQNQVVQNNAILIGNKNELVDSQPNKKDNDWIVFGDISVEKENPNTLA